MGMAIVEDGSGDLLATVRGIFLHPDRGTVEGFFVQTSHGEKFIAVSDITHWGRTIVVRDAESLSHLEERVRLSALREEGRPVIGQKIMTEDGQTVGTCADVQFETETFRLEWIFPRRWFRWKTPLPVACIIDVRPEAVIVRNLLLPPQSLASEPLAMNPLDSIGSSVV